MEALRRRDEVLGTYLISVGADVAATEALSTVPAVVRRFDAVGFPIELITTEWIKTIMMDDFPKSTVFHVWDVMFSGELLPGEGYFLHG